MNNYSQIFKRFILPIYCRSFQCPPLSTIPSSKECETLIMGKHLGRFCFEKLCTRYSVELRKLGETG